jgi:hypothetical protein
MWLFFFTNFLLFPKTFHLPLTFSKKGSLSQDVIRVTQSSPQIKSGYCWFEKTIFVAVQSKPAVIQKSTAVQNATQLL